MFDRGKENKREEIQIDASSSLKFKANEKKMRRYGKNAKNPLLVLFEIISVYNR